MSREYFNSLGYKVINPDHYILIIEDFQRHAGIKDDGIIGPITQGKMEIFNPENFCPEVFEPIKPYVSYGDDQVESIMRPNLIGCGKIFNRSAERNNFDVIHSISHSVLEASDKNGVWANSAIAKKKNNIYGFAAYDRSPMASAKKFTDIPECIKIWSAWWNEYYLLETGKFYHGNHENGVNVKYASSPVAGINKSFIVRELKNRLKYSDLVYGNHITRNIIFGEVWSTKVINGIEFRRRVPPDIEYMPDVIITAEEAQKIRDGLNKEYGRDPRIGSRDKNGEIMILIESFWREIIFQIYLKETGQSTTTDGDHPKGKAIDLATPRGLTPHQFYWFIKYKCNTKFNWFKIYSWGVHCSRR